MTKFFEIESKKEFFNVAKYAMAAANSKKWEVAYADASRLVAAYYTDIFTGLTVFIQKGIGLNKSPRVTLFTDLHTMLVYDEGIIKKYDTTSPYEHVLLDIITE